MHCAYFEADVCRSCSLLETPYARQLADKQAQVAALLPAIDWEEPVPSAESGFRNKAKMVVGGTSAQPTLGILDAKGRGVDLQGCALHLPGIVEALPVLAEFVSTASLTPYDVPARKGELKHLIVTESPDGELMLRFVLRSQESLARIRKHLPSLHEQLPGLRVVSANLLPEHKAVVEGDQELPLSEEESLRMRVNGLDLHLRPQSFFQTNTEVAAALYRLAQEWVEPLDPRTVWDLYCGVGGFALHLAGPRRDTLGIETSVEAVASATLSAGEAGLSARFEARDATTFMRAAAPTPDLIVVNPPRRGIGPELSAWLNASATHVLYSSCHAESLARDLASMPDLHPQRGRLLDMFPHTSHYEVALLLSR